jgi:hypothetical protein
MSYPPKEARPLWVAINSDGANLVKYDPDDPGQHNRGGFFFQGVQLPIPPRILASVAALEEKYATESRERDLVSARREKITEVAEINAVAAIFGKGEKPVAPNSETE